MANPTTAGEAVAGRLLGTDGTDVSTLAALVAARVYPSKPTQEPAGDYVVFYRQGGGDGMTLAGANRLRQHEMHVEATSTSEDGAEAIIEAVDSLLNGWRNTAVGVQGCFAVGDRDEATLEDGRQVSGQTYSLWFRAQ